jgi:hypothetical protein
VGYGMTGTKFFGIFLVSDSPGHGPVPRSLLHGVAGCKLHDLGVRFGKAASGSAVPVRWMCSAWRRLFPDAARLRTGVVPAAAVTRFAAGRRFRCYRLSSWAKGAGFTVCCWVLIVTVFVAVSVGLFWKVTVFGRQPARARSDGPAVRLLVQDGADLGSDESFGQLAKVQGQDGFEGACHVRGCGKEFSQTWIRLQIGAELFPDVVWGPVAVGMLPVMTTFSPSSAMSLWSAVISARLPECPPGRFGPPRAASCS